jgi:hypothetical protein
VDDKDIRQAGYPCPLGAETGPQSIIVRQVITEADTQLALDIHVVVPDPKPAIEQIVDVFIKNVWISDINVITDKMIIRGEFEIKGVYVAALPNNPVHAVEIKHYRWTQYIDMPGARIGMDGDASVTIEFVDYDVDEWYRAYKYKYEDMPEEDECHDSPDGCDDECDDECDDGKHHHHHHRMCREFDVSVVLKFVGKVMANREIQIGGTMPPMPMPMPTPTPVPMPTTPKG